MGRGRRPPVVEIPEFLCDADLGGVGVLLGALDEPAGHGCHWLTGRAQQVTAWCGRASANLRCIERWRSFEHRDRFPNPLTLARGILTKVSLRCRWNAVRDTRTRAGRSFPRQPKPTPSMR